MNFFEHQDQALKRTRWLQYAYMVTVVGIIAVVHAAVVAAVVLGSKKSYPRFQPWDLVGFQLPILAAVAIVVLFVIAIGSALKKRELRVGGSAVAEWLGGRQIYHSTQDPLERKVWNVVEEMAIASGVPVPAVYLLDNETAINAFAAGNSIEDAVIGITRGCAEQLKRDQLQGVVAHEFSHVLHGDMALNLKLLSTLAGITLLSNIGYIILRSMGNSSGRRRSSNSKDGGGGGAIILVGLALYVAGGVGAFAAALIQAAISRQREYLADAAAVQFTRNPEGISGALRAIGGFSAGTELEHARAGEVRHMFFGRGSRMVFATHPPLAERINRIEGVEGEAALKAGTATYTELGSPEGAMGFAATSAAVTPGTAPAGRNVAMLAMVGETTGKHVQKAHEMIEGIPTVIRSALEDAYSARAVVLCLLLDDDPVILGKQLGVITKAGGSPFQQEVEKLLAAFSGLNVELRVPLLDMAKGTLKELTRPQYRQFRTMFKEVIQCDDRLSLFEWMVSNSLFTHLDGHFGQREKRSSRRVSLEQCAGEVQLLLSAMAHAGSRDLPKAEQAYRDAVAGISGEVKDLLDRSKCAVSKVEKAMHRIARLVPEDLKMFLGACVRSVTADGVVSQLEAELLRVFSETLGCPVPPLLPGQRFADGSN